MWWFIFLCWWDENASWERTLVNSAGSLLLVNSAESISSWGIQLKVLLLNSAESASGISRDTNCTNGCGCSKLPFTFGISDRLLRVNFASSWLHHPLNVHCAPRFKSTLLPQSTMHKYIFTFCFASSDWLCVCRARFVHWRGRGERQTSRQLRVVPHKTLSPSILWYCWHTHP